MSVPRAPTQLSVAHVPVPDVPPGNLFEPPQRVLLSQGEVRPGMRQGQHWGYRRSPRSVPRSHADPRLANMVLH